jgi:SnoaL-like domain
MTFSDNEMDVPSKKIDSVDSENRQIHGGKCVMKESSMSRRAAIGAGVCALAAVSVPLRANAHTAAALSPKAEEIVRKYYAAWEQTDWRPFDLLLADNFTFTSAAGDDHISRSTFQVKCWGSQKDFIERFDLVRVFGSGNEAFVLYVCHTKNGKTLSNVEYLRLAHDKVESIECYFGAQSSFPSAVSTNQG